MKEKFLLAAFLAGSVAQAADFNGVWNASYVTAEGQTRKSTLTLAIDQQNVTGSISSPRGTAKIEGGEVKGNAITFYVIRKSNYDEVKINFSGTMKGNVLALKMQFGARVPVAMSATKE